MNFSFGSALIKKGTKTNETAAPKIIVLKSVNKIKVNSAAAKLLGIQQGEFVNFYDAGTENTPFNARYFVSAGYMSKGVPVGYTLGGHNIVSSAAVYAPMILNEEGATQASLDDLKAINLVETYKVTPKEGNVDKNKTAERCLVEVHYNLERCLLEGEDGEVIDMFSPNEKEGIAPMPMFKLVNRDERNEESDEDAD
jgi:hypothetical protein